MEQAVEQTMERVRMVYEMVTGQPAPEFSADSPYARIPPEVDREEHVLRQAAALFERVVSRPAAQVGNRVAPEPISVHREGNDLRFVFDVGPTPRERISVELHGTELRVSSDRADSTVGADSKQDTEKSASRARVTQTALLPARVDPNEVKAEFTDGFLTVRVRMPLFDDAIHKIEIR